MSLAEPLPASKLDAQLRSHSLGEIVGTTWRHFSEDDQMVANSDSAVAFRCGECD